MSKESFKDYVRRQHSYIRQKMSLNEWQGGISWQDQECEEDEKAKDNRKVQAECDVNLKYLEYVIKIYPICEKKYNDGKHEEVFHTVLHELCHVYTEPMYVFGWNSCHPERNDELLTLREQATQRIAYAINALVPAEQSAPLYDNEVAPK